MKRRYISGRTPPVHRSWANNPRGCESSKNPNVMLVLYYIYISTTTNLDRMNTTKLRKVHDWYSPPLSISTGPTIVLEPEGLSIRLTTKGAQRLGTEGEKRYGSQFNF